jgi:hypothetical protein
VQLAHLILQIHKLNAILVIKVQSLIKMKRNASLYAAHRHFMIGIPILANHAMLALSSIQVKSNAKPARPDAANVAITLLNSKLNAKPASLLLF